MPGEPCLYTIGFEGREAPELFAALAEHKVTLLLDIRQNPNSRKPGYSKKALTASCAGHGLGYEHMVSLSAPKALRVEVQCTRDYGLLRCGYTECLAERGEALQALQEKIASETVCLLCYERDPAACHRSILAGVLNDRLGGKLKIVDL
ncbi:DUF488 domain-containing protein [bacterium]|nr:DUF488 domain-containing protein [bacterium]